MSERTRGLYLEEFEVGHTYVSRERVITQADVDAALSALEELSRGRA